MAVYALDREKDVDVYETFIGSVIRTSWEGRRAGANTFYIAGDLNVELELPCTDDDDVAELSEMYDPLCWQGWRKIQEAVVVRDCERVQLQNDIHLLPRTDNLGTMEKEGRRSWITSSGPRGHLMRPSYTMTFRFGTHGTIIFCMLRCMKMTLKIIA